MKQKIIVFICILFFVLQKANALIVITNNYPVSYVPTLNTQLDTVYHQFNSYFVYKKNNELNIIKAYDSTSYRLNMYIMLLVDYENELDTTITLHLYSNKDRYNYVGEVVSVNNNNVIFRASKQITSNKQFITLTLQPKQTLHACLLYQPISFKDYYFRRNANDLYVYQTKYHFPVFESFFYKRNIGYTIQYFVLLGMICIMYIFYILAYFYLKDKIYLYYSYYLLCTFLQVLYMMQYEISRIMVMFNFVGNSGFDEITKGLMIYFYAQFYAQVFHVDKSHKALFYAIQWMKITSLVYTLIIAVGYIFKTSWYNEPLIYALYRIPIFTLSFAMIFFVAKIKQLSFFQKIIWLGSLVYILFNVVSLIQKIDFPIKDLLLEINTLYLGILFELVIFSIALIIRIKDSFIASEKLKDQLIVELQKNEVFISNENILLENKIKERVTEIEQKNSIIEEQKRIALVELFEKEKAQIQLKALSAQMNPHFIFNCMNSIQSAIIINDTKKASSMLNNFALLIRMVLEHSTSNSISLENEIKLLETYLNIEQVRTNYIFDYSINIEKNIAADFIEIPTMLLQPFLENAIWHGFNQINYKGKIDIVFKQKENLIICTITDNGIGREQASKNAITIPKKSMAIAIIQNKINLINQSLIFNKASLNIIDLKDEQQKPTGTKIIIELPII